MVVLSSLCRGLYMSDLTFLDNGNPNFHSDGLINFSKCRLIYNQIRDIILRQVGSLSAASIGGHSFSFRHLLFDWLLTC